MFVLSWIKFFRGYVYVHLTGYATERFLNLCGSRNILIWNLKPTEDGYYFYISVDGYRSLKPILKKTKTKARILKKYGVPFQLFRYRKHKVFAAGIAVSAVLLFYCSGFVWNIEVKGNSYLSEETILTFLQNENAGFGVPKRNINCEELEEKLRSAYSEVIWTSVKVYGTKMTVELQENLLPEEEYEAKINLPGGYNIYNACAAMAAGQAMGLDAATTAKSLSEFACGFGRMEKFEIGGTDVRMILIKNPAGCNQVLNFLTQIREPFVFVACLNDRAQDGKDVSWIWDVDFERLCEMGDTLREIYVSGVRADDMALRFAYAGFPTNRIHVVKDYKALCEQSASHKLPVYMMPTYTAMLALRQTISKTYGYKNFWE